MQFGEGSYLLTSGNLIVEVCCFGQPLYHLSCLDQSCSARCSTSMDSMSLMFAYQYQVPYVPIFVIGFLACCLSNCSFIHSTDVWHGSTRGPLCRSCQFILQFGSTCLFTYFVYHSPISKTLIFRWFGFDHILLWRWILLCWIEFILAQDN